MVVQSTSRLSTFLLFIFIQTTQVQPKQFIFLYKFFFPFNSTSLAAFNREAPHFFVFDKKVQGIHQTIPKSGVPSDWPNFYNRGTLTTAIKLLRVEPMECRTIKLDVQLTFNYESSPWAYDFPNHIKRVFSDPKRGSYLEIMSRQFGANNKTRRSIYLTTPNDERPSCKDSTTINSLSCDFIVHSLCPQASSVNNFIKSKTCKNGELKVLDRSRCVSSTTTVCPGLGLESEWVCPWVPTTTTTTTTTTTKTTWTTEEDHHTMEGFIGNINAMMINSIADKTSPSNDDQPISSDDSNYILHMVDFLAEEEFDHSLTDSQMAVLRSSIKAVALRLEIEDSYDFRGRNIAVQIKRMSKLNPDMEYSVVKKVNETNGKMSLEIVAINSSDKTKPSSKSESKRSLPESAGFVIPLKSILKYSKVLEGSKEDRISTYVFPADIFSPASNSSSLALASTNVFSIEIPAIENIILKENLTIIFDAETERLNSSHSHGVNEIQICIYWDPKFNMNEGGWSSHGCTLVRKSPPTCSCNHLSSFSLMAMSGISTEHEERMNMISITGSMISFMSLVMTLLTYLCFGRLRENIPSKILICICSCLLMADILYVTNKVVVAVGIDEIQRGVGFESYLCRFVAMLYHYFLLSALAWMGANGFFMYKSLIEVFGMFPQMMRNLSIVSFGTPFLIVLLTAAVDFKGNYGLVNSDLCWVTPQAVHPSFTAPVAVMFLGNLAIFTRVFFEVKRVSVSETRRSKVSKVGFQMKGGVSMVFILGLTWGFGLFAIGEAQTVFAYFFVIFNSLQGFFIFIFYCLLKKDAKSYWKRGVLNVLESYFSYDASYRTTDNTKSKSMNTTANMTYAETTEGYEYSSRRQRDYFAPSVSHPVDDPGQFN